MIAGFTGTRHGMAEEQKLAFSLFLSRLRPTEFHHGDCLGADVQAAGIAKSSLYCVCVVCHPPVDETHRGFFPNNDLVLAPLTHFARNREIVNRADILLACPCELTEQPSGGTWYTVRYARKTKKLICIFWPDGSLKHEDQTQETGGKR